MAGLSFRGFDISAVPVHYGSGSAVFDFPPAPAGAKSANVIPAYPEEKRRVNIAGFDIQQSAELQLVRDEMAGSAAADRTMLFLCRYHRPSYKMADPGDIYRCGPDIVLACIGLDSGAGLWRRRDDSRRLSVLIY